MLTVTRALRLPLLCFRSNEQAHRFSAAATAALALLLDPVLVAGAGASQLPAFWGGVAWVDGELAPPGVAVKAMQGKGTTTLGEGVVEAGAGSSRFRLTSRPPT